MPQMQLPFFPEGTTEINANLGFIRRGNQVTYIYGHLPIFQHEVEDIRAFRMMISQIYLNGSAKQSEISRAFGVSKISVKRAVKICRKKGVSGFYEEARRRGAAVLKPSVLEEAQQLLDNGVEVPDVADKLGIKKDTLRKAVNSGRLHKFIKKTACLAGGATSARPRGGRAGDCGHL